MFFCQFEAFLKSWSTSFPLVGLCKNMIKQTKILTNVYNCWCISLGQPLFFGLSIVCLKNQALATHNLRYWTIISFCAHEGQCLLCFEIIVFLQVFSISLLTNANYYKVSSFKFFFDFHDQCKLLSNFFPCVSFWKLNDLSVFQPNFSPKNSKSWKYFIFNTTLILLCLIGVWLEKKNNFSAIN